MFQNKKNHFSSIFQNEMLHLFKNVDLEMYRKEAAELLKMAWPMVSINQKYTMNIIKDR